MERALQQLPDTRDCPHALLRTLWDLTDAHKRIAVVRDTNGTPAAVIPLAKHNHEWKPISVGSTARICAVAPGSEATSLRSLGVPVRIDYWPAELPHDAQRVNWDTQHRLRPGADYQQYWKERGRWKGIREARNRTRDFEFEVDADDSCAWTLRRWNEKWHKSNGLALPSVEPQIAAWKVLFESGASHAFRLMDGANAAAGIVGIVLEDQLVLTYNYRDPAYDWHGAGNRLMELVVEWTLAQGLAINFGGGFEYKDKWAPEDGGYWQFSMWPWSYRARSLPTRSIASASRRAGTTWRRVSGRD